MKEITFFYLVKRVCDNVGYIVLDLLLQDNTFIYTS